MTREECLAYRQRCPYDAMGDFSVFSEKKEDSKRVCRELSFTVFSSVMFLFSATRKRW